MKICKYCNNQVKTLNTKQQCSPCYYRDYYARNREKRIASQQKYLSTHPAPKRVRIPKEQLKIIRVSKIQVKKVSINKAEYMRNYRRNNPEAVKRANLRQLEYYQENRTKVLEKLKIQYQLKKKTSIEKLNSDI